jgi:hypothetical protein
MELTRIIPISETTETGWLSIGKRVHNISDRRSINVDVVVYSLINYSKDFAADLVALLSQRISIEQMGRPKPEMEFSLQSRAS